MRDSIFPLEVTDYQIAVADDIFTAVEKAQGLIKMGLYNDPFELNGITYKPIGDFQYWLYRRMKGMTLYPITIVETSKRSLKDYMELDLQDPPIIKGCYLHYIKTTDGLRFVDSDNSDKLRQDTSVVIPFAHPRFNDHTSWHRDFLTDRLKEANNKSDYRCKQNPKGFTASDWLYKKCKMGYDKDLGAILVSHTIRVCGECHREYEEGLDV